jgi:hypothetical protein
MIATTGRLLCRWTRAKSWKDADNTNDGSQAPTAPKRNRTAGDLCPVRQLLQLESIAQHSATGERMSAAKLRALTIFQAQGISVLLEHHGSQEWMWPLKEFPCCSSITDCFSFVDNVQSSELQIAGSYPGGTAMIHSRWQRSCRPSASRGGEGGEQRRAWRVYRRSKKVQARISGVSMRPCRRIEAFYANIWIADINRDSNQGVLYKYLDRDY